MYIFIDNAYGMESTHNMVFKKRFSIVCWLDALQVLTLRFYIVLDKTNS